MFLSWSCLHSWFFVVPQTHVHPTPYTKYPLFFPSGLPISRGLFFPPHRLADSDSQTARLPGGRLGVGRGSRHGASEQRHPPGDADLRLRLPGERATTRRDSSRPASEQRASELRLARRERTSQSKLLKVTLNLPTASGISPETNSEQLSECLFHRRWIVVQSAMEDVGMDLREGVEELRC